MKRIIKMVGLNAQMDIEVLQEEGKEVLVCEGRKFYNDKEVTEYAQNRLKEIRRIQCQR